MEQTGLRFITTAESRYAMIELECLGAAWAMSKCKQFLEGLPTFELVLDHRPLMGCRGVYAVLSQASRTIIQIQNKFIEN
jgi:hypothetical protein